MIEDLNQGVFVVASDGNSLAFKPMDVVQLEVELEHRKGKEKLEIDLSWKLEGSVEKEDKAERGEGGSKMPRWIWGIIGVILVIVAIILILRLV